MRWVLDTTLYSEAGGSDNDNIPFHGYAGSAGSLSASASASASASSPPPGSPDVKSISASSSSASQKKGQSCASASNSSSSSAKKGVQFATPGDFGDECDSTEVSVYEILRSVHSFIEKEVLSSPALVAQKDMHAYFDVLAGLAMAEWKELNNIYGNTHVASNIVYEQTEESTDLMGFIRTLTDRALALYGSNNNKKLLKSNTRLYSGSHGLVDTREWEECMWAHRENIEVLSNHPANAAQIKWRKSQAGRV